MAFYRYRLYTADGADAGEVHYAYLVQPGETIMLAPGRHVRVLEVVAVDDDDSPYVGLLKVEPV